MNNILFEYERYSSLHIINQWYNEYNNYNYKIICSSKKFSSISSDMHNNKLLIFQLFVISCSLYSYILYVYVSVVKNYWKLCSYIESFIINNINR